MAAKKHLNIQETTDVSWIKLSFKYDAEMQHRLKIEVGFGNYRYENTIWLVRRAHYQEIIKLFKRYGYEVRSTVTPNDQSHNRQKGNYRPGSGREQYHQRSKREDDRFRDAFEDFFGGSNNYRSTQDTSNPYVAVFESLDPSLAEKTYRRLASVLHPDVGGSEEAMKQLNMAWDAYKEIVEVRNV